MKIKKEINNKINLVNNLISGDNKDIEDIDIKIEKLEKKQEILNRAITESQNPQMFRFFAIRFLSIA
ncbi:hypothetical protein ACT7DB_00780 [Bacillus cereus]